VAILKYKNYLGGSFISKEKLKECFIINEEQFSQMLPYLILQDKTPGIFAETFANPSRKEVIKVSHYFDPNSLNAEEWQQLGFSEKQANVIVNYRDKNLKGSFRSLEDIQNCFVISEEKFGEMKPWIKLSYPEKKEEKPMASEKPILRK
jgi:DNA uptake protein ComE-like DNA-binding protein